MSTDTLTSPPPLPASRAFGHWAPLPVVLAGTFMMVLDFFIVNVALPAMQTGLHASSGAVEWVVAGYGLTTAVFLITGARLGDRIGRMRVFTAGLALFTLSSAGCGLAPTPGVLVAARLVQGASAALLGPNVLAIITVLYTGADRARALAAYGMSMGVAAVSGQLIGGVLVQANLAGLGWRSCFLINIPIGLAALAAAPRVIPESRAPSRPGLDLGGTILATLALTAVMLPLVDGRAHGWPLWTWLSLAAAPALVAALVGHQRRLAAGGGAPLLPPGLFAIAEFRAGLAAQLLFWCGQGSFFLILTLYLQLGRGLSALHAGLMVTILAVTYVVASLRAPALAERHGRRVLAVGAGVLAAGHLALLAAVADIGSGGSLGVLVPGLMLVGIGMGLVISTVPAIVMAVMPAEHIGATSGVLTTVQFVGSALGVAVIGVLFYGAVGHGFAPAFELSVAVLAVTLAAVAGVSRLLPAPVR
ncbi:MAG TPA: MFS transporter [Solirubrobacteraceae bacterium]|nr:MFS transporter [Solirubrobacteraceae bacterium]